ncbi:paraquat-inducible protein B [Desulfobotulus alkaliphilus]|uniref:Paraquat-inducible protein B n=1 Tax=Desulfobotulus alkaliphilus TaxID=622671 RepID=A0A562RIG6_9BACT|nr:MlaD family protein [Desulfobotulus alkaliphilus]TWI68882.1 paraquat-inducible protein B [Desulfobotulus alkaliphilus]
MNGHDTELPEITMAKSRFWIWLIPLAAMLMGGWLLFQHYAQRGVLITVSFETASGLVAGKTQLRFKDLTIGTVESLELSQDLSHIMVHVRVAREVLPYLTEDSRFWVVRPRIDRQGISGLNTLLSGAYIAIEPGSGKPATVFTGLENPPITPSETPGLRILLETDSGGIEVGTPVYFRKIHAGTVEARTILGNHDRILLDVFIKSPYDAHVTASSRFWRDSGIDFSFGADGIRFQSESLESMLVGGIAFDNPDPAASSAKNEDAFHLFPSFREIRSRSMQMGKKFVLYFDSSIRGLNPGAPVDYKGVQIGEVLSVRLYYDKDSDSIQIPVKISILPEILMGNHHAKAETHLMEMLEKGLKARLEMGNMLTGQLFISMEMDSDNPSGKLSYTEEGLPVIPTLPHPFTQLAGKAMAVFDRIQKLPMEGIAGNTIATMKEAQALLKGLQEIPEDIKPLLAYSQEVLAAIQMTLEGLNEGLDGMKPGSPLYRDLSQAARELAESARAIRILAESIEARPDTLIYGK